MFLSKWNDKESWSKAGERREKKKPRTKNKNESAAQL